MRHIGRVGASLGFTATGDFYKITHCIDLKTDFLHPVRIAGEGDGPIIKNVRGGGHEGVCFRPGRLVAGDSQFTGPGQKRYKMERAQRGADRIYPIGAPSGTFKRGDMVFVFSKERGTPGGQRSRMWWPWFPHIGIVYQVLERGGLLISTPEHPNPLRYDYAGAEVAKFPHGCSHGSVENLRLEYQSNGFNAFSGGGNVDYVFRNINVTRGHGVFGGNGYAHSLIQNIRGRPFEKGLELAYFSHSCTIRNIDIEPAPQPITRVRALFYLAQGTHNCLVEDARLDHKDRLPVQLGTVFGHGGIMPGGRNNVLRRYKSYSTRFNLGLNISGSADKPVAGNRLEDSTIIAKGAKYALRSSSGGLGNHKIVYNRLEAGETSVVLGSDTDNTLVAHNVVPQGVKDHGKNNTVRHNSKTDTLHTGPR